jgi:hypothetical protein
MRDVFYYLPLINSSDMAFFGLRHGKSTRRWANFFLCPWYEHPGHTFQLAEHNILLCLLVLVRAKNVLLILYVGNMHWFTLINNIRQLHWLSLWLQSKLQILSNNNVALKNADYGWSWQLRLIFNRLYSLLLNHPSPSDHNFMAYNWSTAEKERVSDLVMSQRKLEIVG